MLQLFISVSKKLCCQFSLIEKSATDFEYAERQFPKLSDSMPGPSDR